MFEVKKLNPNFMDANKSQDVITELLRIGLIAVRNLAEIPHRTSNQDAMLREWATLCHSLPPMLLGQCGGEVVRYFARGDATRFLRDYPAKADADYGQARGLLDELASFIRQSESPRST